MYKREHKFLGLIVLFISFEEKMQRLDALIYPNLSWLLIWYSKAERDFSQNLLRPGDIKFF